jgi:putative transposase
MSFVFPSLLALLARLWQVMVVADAPATSHRIAEIAWWPRTAREREVFTAVRMESARLWNDLTVRHARIRRLHWKWPPQARWMAWAKGRYPALSAQSVQQVVLEFLGAVAATTAARKAWKARKPGDGTPEPRYPWRKRRYRHVTYSSQTLRVADGILYLPHGKADREQRTLCVPMPTGLVLPGRAVEARLELGHVSLICRVPPDAEATTETPAAACDQGVNSLVAVTNGKKVVVVSGREIKAIVQYRNKALAEISQRQAGRVKGSKRWRREQKAKKRLLARSSRQIRDICHKATRAVARAFPGHRVVIGRPFNAAAQKMGRKQAQLVSQATTAKVRRQFAYKLPGCTEVEEHYTSQTCPGCGNRRKCRREYRCPVCGLLLPRDAVGAWNILQVGTIGHMKPGKVPDLEVVFVRPLRKYPGRGAPAAVRMYPRPGSTGGTPACCPEAA